MTEVEVVKVVKAKKRSLGRRGVGLQSGIECLIYPSIATLHLIATAHHVGAYWSSGGVSDSTLPPGFENATEMAEFLSQSSPHFDTTNTVCLGWFFIGDCGDLKWPAGRRRPIEEKISWA